MSYEWTPTTEIVREAFSNDPEVEYHDPIGFAGYVAENRRMFDRWLAAADAATRTAALEEAAGIAERYDKGYGQHPNDGIVKATQTAIARVIRSAKDGAQ